MRAGKTIVEVELGSVQIVNFFSCSDLFVLTDLMFLSDLWEMGILSPRVRKMQKM